MHTCFDCLCVLIPASIAVSGCFKENCNCPSSAAVTLHVLDAASGAPIATPSSASIFTANGHHVAYECGDATDAGACSAWEIYDAYGPTTIHVAVAGYRPEDMTSNVQHENNCCGTPMNPLDATVRLTKL